MSIKISELNECTENDSESCLPIVSGDETKKIFWKTLINFLNSDLKFNDMINQLKNDLQANINKCFTSVTYNPSSGILTFTSSNNEKMEIDLPLEVLVESGKYDETTKQIILTLANKNELTIPLSDLIDDFYTKLKVDELLQEKQDQIEELKAANQEQQEQLDLLYSEFGEKTLSGESVAIADGLQKTKVAVDVNGNSYQETTDGHQLLNIEDYSDTGNLITSTTSNKIVATSRLASDYVYEQVIYFDNVKLKTGITYTLRRVMKVISGTPKSITGQMELYVGGTWKKVVGNGSATGYDTKNTFTVDEDNTYRLRIKLANAGDVTEVFSVEFSNLIIYEGTEDLPYEPYTNGASPNTEYEQDIEVVDMVNIFDKDNVNVLDAYFNNIANPNLTQFASVKTVYRECKENTEYTISKMASARFYVGYTTELPAIGVTVHNILGTDTKQETIKTITTGDNAKYLVIFLYHSTHDAGITFEEILDTVQIVEGTETKPYLPYGHIGLLQQNKNMFSFDKAILKHGSALGVTYEDKKITMITSGGTWSNAYVMFKNPKKNSYIFVGADFLETLTASKKGVSIYGNNSPTLTGVTSLISVMQDVSLNTKKRIAAGANTGNYEYIMIRFWDNATATSLTTKTNCVVDNIQMEFGQPTEYEEHKERVIPINLNGNSIAKVGDIKDILNIGVDGSVKIGDKVIKEYVFTGDENFERWNGNNKSFILTMPNLNSAIYESTIIPNIKCNYANAGTRGTVWSITENIKDIISVSDNTIYLILKEIKEVEDLKAWLKEKYNNGTPMKILYALAEQYSETIELPSIEPIELFEGTNIFELVTNLGTTMAVTYKVSNKKQIKNLQAQIDELKTAIVTLGAV